MMRYNMMSLCVSWRFCQSSIAVEIELGLDSGMTQHYLADIQFNICQVYLVSITF